MKMLTWLFGVAALLALPVVASAEVENVQTLPDSLNWIAVLYSAVFAAAILVVAFKNAKRTHLD